MESSMDVYEELIRERDAGRDCALATIVNVVGSIPSYATAKLLMREDGSIVGTVGGGAAEAAVMAAAREVLAGGKAKMISFDLHENPRMDIGMVCGGSLDLFIEPIRPAPVVYLVGAGHVGALTARAAALARIEVEVIDDRPEFANKERFPDARAIHAGDFEASLAAIKPNHRALVFIAARGHELDARALKWAVGTPAAYIGMIGSKRKILSVYRKLEAEGVTDEQFDRVHAPVGLNIGATTPEEIAISVVAEMVACIRNAAAASPLMSNMRELAGKAGRAPAPLKVEGRRTSAKAAMRVVEPQVPAAQPSELRTA
jgi:xanthine dehydrogenase accessory factor